MRALFFLRQSLILSSFVSDLMWMCTQKLACIWTLFFFYSSFFLMRLWNENLITYYFVFLIWRPTEYFYFNIIYNDIIYSCLHRSNYLNVSSGNWGSDLTCNKFLAFFSVFEKYPLPIYDWQRNQGMSPDICYLHMHAPRRHQCIYVHHWPRRY